MKQQQPQTGVQRRTLGFHGFEQKSFEVRKEKFSPEMRHL